ncbi:MAG TPA: hypothetical protein VFF08_09620, partial [Trueperaceae bacterium]|nr:hypothetical protein [Trueperaceae bacterium]
MSAASTLTRPVAASGAPRWLRVLLPGVVIAAWLAVSAVGGPYFGRVDEVSSDDPTAYLPDSAEATTVQRLLGEFVGTGSVPAVVVFTSDSPLTQEQLAALSEGLAAAAELEGVAGATSPAIPSEDGLAAQAFVPVVADDELAAHVAALGSALRSD